LGGPSPQVSAHDDKSNRWPKRSSIKDVYLEGRGVWINADGEG